MSYIIPITVVFLNCILGAVAALFLKKGTAKQGLVNKEVSIGILLYVIGAVIFIIALKYAPVSVLYPVTAATYIWSFIFAKVYLNEKITKYKIFGLCLIILGIILISLV
jgi:drug/metabolite transporter (DMT)-like permease